MTVAKAQSYIRPPSFHDDERRSRSLDGDLAFGANSQQTEKSNGNKNSKSAWKKVKGIVTSRSSRKSIKSAGSANSRDVSPIDINDLQRDRSDSISSPNQSSSSPNNLNLPDIDLCPTSDENENTRKYDDARAMRFVRQSKRGSKKSKLIPDIESLPENETLEASNRRQLPSPLIIKKVKLSLILINGAFFNYFIKLSRILVNQTVLKEVARHQRGESFTTKSTCRFPIPIVR